MKYGEAILVGEPDLKNRTVSVVLLGEVLGEDTVGSIMVHMNSTYARLAAKRLVDAADKIDIERFVEDGAPLQRVDCE